MAVKYLLLHSRVRIPHSASLITTGRNDLIALWVELNFRYLIFVTLKKCSASAREYIIDPGKTISRSGGEFVSCIIESSIQHLVIVPFEGFYALAGGNVP